MKTLFLLFFAHSLWSSVLVGMRGDDILSVRKINRAVEQDQVLVREIPFFLDEHSEPSIEMYREVLYAEWSIPKEVLKFSEEYKKEKFDSESRVIIKQGNPENRIVLTFLGDGYQESEKEKFFEDVNRLVDEMFQGKTFSSYLPIFNIYAIFVPSKDSGITDLKKKDTAFGLYRSPKGSKRGIIPRKTFAIEKVLRSLPFSTDYPIIVANDEFYGGLGGRYAITTRSKTSGTMVLRHELGHNFGNVGEEYDGGRVYMGANFSSGRSITWDHWIDGDVQYNQALNIGGAYVWQPLNKRPFSYDFSYPGDLVNGEYLFKLSLSSVGWERPNEVSVSLDGENLNYEGLFTKDRSFFNATQLIAPDKKKHKIMIKESISDGDNVLASARLYLYPPSFDFTHEKVAAFANYNDNGRMVGYRPTNEMCLMRDMRSTKFCPVDQENMWRRFLKKVDLIDSIEYSEKKVKLVVPDLPTKIRWYFEGKEMKSIEDKLEWIPSSSGRYEVRIEFISPEVRSKESLFQASRRFSL